jgi:hypothetical protein
MAEIGTVTVKVIPDLTGFTGSVRKAVFSLALDSYTVWLTNKGYIDIGGKGWKPAGDLVDQYLAESGEGASES